MKKLHLGVAVLALLFLGVGYAHATSYGINVSQRDVTDSFDTNYQVVPDNTYWTLMAINPSSKQIEEVRSIDNTVVFDTTYGLRLGTGVTIGNINLLQDNLNALYLAISTTTSAINSFSGSVSSEASSRSSGDAALQAQINTIASSTVQAYEGTTTRLGAFPVFKSATVSSGTAVFNITNDGTSGGTFLCPHGVIQDSVNPFVSDAAASYQMSAAWSNGNKTLTITTNKLTTANILTGILGQASGNGSVVKVTVWCY